MCVCVALSHVADTHTHPHTRLSLARGHWSRGSAYTARPPQHFFHSLPLPLSLPLSLSPSLALAFFSLGDSGGGGDGLLSLPAHNRVFFISLQRIPLQQGIVCACVRARAFKRFTMPEYPCPPRAQRSPPTVLFLQEASSEHLSVTAKQSRSL